MGQTSVISHILYVQIYSRCELPNNLHLYFIAHPGMRMYTFPFPKFVFFFLIIVNQWFSEIKRASLRHVQIVYICSAKRMKNRLFSLSMEEGSFGIEDLVLSFGRTRKNAIFLQVFALKFFHIFPFSHMKYSMGSLQAPYSPSYLICFISG